MINDDQEVIITIPGSDDTHRVHGDPRIIYTLLITAQEIVCIDYDVNTTREYVLRLVPNVPFYLVYDECVIEDVPS
jgi:hypothetical protein